MPAAKKPVVHRIPADSADYLSGPGMHFDEASGAHLVQAGSKTINMNKIKPVFPTHDDSFDGPEFGPDGGVDEEPDFGY